MSNLTSVGIANGVPNSGTGTVSTLDNLLGTAGAPSANVQSMQGVSGGTALPVSAASLPLPSGAATSAGVAAVVTALGTPMQQTGGTVSLTPSTTDVAVTPTVTAGAYTSGYVLGGIMTFASLLAATSFNGVLQSITAKFKGTAVTGNISVALFKASPSNGTYADHTAPVWNSADMANLVGIYQLTNPISVLGTMTAYNLDGIGKALVGASQSLYAVVIVAGTPTPASTSDFTLELSVLPG